MDKERVLVKIDRLDRYLDELRDIMPEKYESYQKIEKKRACERLLQVSIESVLDICAQIVIELRLGLPSEEDDILLDKSLIIPFKGCAISGSRFEFGTTSLILRFEKLFSSISRRPAPAWATPRKSQSILLP